MKIGPIESKPAATGTAAERSKSAAAPGINATSKAPESSAKVDLSPAASSASSAKVASASDGSFDSAKVERIAQAIRDGKFSVNADAIADKLIINAEELLGRKLSS